MVKSDRTVLSVFTGFMCVLFFSGLMAGCSPEAPGVAEGGELQIVEDGAPAAVIVVDREAYEQDGRGRNALVDPHAVRGIGYRKYPDRLEKFRERHVDNDSWIFSEPGSVNEAAGVFADKIKKSTGAELPIVFEAPAEGSVVYIGDSGPARRFGIDQSGMESDGFDIYFPDERSVVILGPGKSGTEFGVYEFLERFVGVRWLMPGEHGVDVPELRDIAVPRENIRQEPAFWSRRWTAPYREWSRRLRLHNRQPRAHFLWALFWVEDYLESHPHFFPEYGGERMTSVPGYTRATARSWQPCFTAEGIVEEAVASIVEYFDLNPRLAKYYPTYSIAINDGTNNYCECPDCMALISGEDNVQGFVDYSAPYFSWANEVAAGVAEEYPDAYLYVLAYQHTFEPPDFKLHPNLVVGIAYDWMRLLDPEIEESIGGVLRDWSEKASQVRTGEYLYGRFYLLPRIYTRYLAELYRWKHEHNVTLISSQAGFHLGEIPKYYGAARLKWDPYLDIDELLDDWYLHCVGAEAAPYLKRYFDFWEDFWTRRILDTNWGRHFRMPGTFLPFRHSSRAPTYLLDVTCEEMARLRGWMERAAELAEPGPRSRRAEILFKTFEYYETTRLLYRAGEIEYDDPEVLAAQFEPWIDAARTREHLINEVFPETTGLQEVRYTPGDMPFLGMDQVVRVLWRNRDLIYDSDKASESLREAVRRAGDERLDDVAERIFALGEAVEVDPAALRDGLVLHLPMDHGEGDRALDAGPHGNHGRITRPVWVEDRPGGEGWSLQFGPDTRVECPHHDSLNTEEAQTISVWIKLNDLGTSGWYWMFEKQSMRGRDATIGWIISGTHDDQRPGYGGRIEPRANAGGSWGRIAPYEVLHAERWYHAVAVYHHEDGGQFYIDAFPVSPVGTRGRGKIAVNTAPLILKNDDAVFYDFRVYDRALSEEEIIALYQLGLD